MIVVSFSLSFVLLGFHPAGVSKGQETPENTLDTGDAAESSPPSAPENPPAETQELDPAEILKQFKERAPEEIREAGLLAMDKFLTTAEEFQRSVIEMRKQHTLYANGYVTEKKPYLDLRDRSRDLMNQAFTERLSCWTIFRIPTRLGSS